MRSWTVGGIQIDRIDDPGHDLVLPQDEGTVAVLKQAPWLQPSFVTDDWSLVIGSSATVIRSGGCTVVVDPFLAFDDPGRLDERVATLCRAAGDVDVVINTHVDGIGANLRADGSPAFPGARYLVPRAELEALREGVHEDERGAPFVELWNAGVVEASDGNEEVAPGVRLEDAPGHNRGHHVVWVEDGNESAVVVGHLFLHPAQIANTESDIGDLDPVALARTRRALLERCVQSGSRVIGPLFADPGAGTVEPDGDTWRLKV